MPDTITPTDLSNEALSRAVEGARAALLRRQRPDGHWVFELEADSTIPAEYVLLENFLDRIDPDLENKIGVYLRAAQGEHGGWPLFHDGCLNLSCSVKAYYALRCIGDWPTRRTWFARVRRSSRRVALSERTFSPAHSWRCSARCRGGPCR